jgi:AraC family transcriptional regulator
MESLQAMGNFINRTHITIVNQGVDFIIGNLFEKITVDMIADHCCFSRYYFSRLFKSVVGESLYSFIKRLRIETAAFKLIKFPNLRITRVAAELGYSSSNFTVLFKKYYGVSPSQFRLNPKLPFEPESRSILRRIQNLQKTKPLKLLKQMEQHISFETLPDIRILYHRFIGNYKDLPETWQYFCEKIKNSFPDSPLEFYGISYDDPLIVGENRCLYDLCVRVTNPSKLAGTNYKTIPGGLFLCYRFDDHVRNLSQIYNDLFAIWMPHKGYVMDNRLSFEHYHEGTEPGGHLVMDLCIPIVSKTGLKFRSKLSAH